ncbi:MAG: ABC transporter substrate-binding protein [Candidatus Omnitrophota bacterium]
MKKISILLIVILLVFLIIDICSAEVGVSSTEIVVGQSAALGGPAQGLGKGMKAGMEAYFKYINSEGGVNGRRIRLISYDDGYEPDRCIEQTRKLIEEGVFVLIGYVGTPTSNAAVPIAEKEHVPYIGPFTGAEFLRNPVKHYVMNIRGSYYNETEGLVKHLTEDLGIKKIACFYQNDSYGQAGLAGVQRALESRKMSLAGEGTYERNTLAVKGGLARIKAGSPEAVIMIGAYAPCAAFIKLAKQIGMAEVKFCNVSFVGSDNLKEALGEAGEGTIISQVVPFPWDMSIPVVEEYHRMIKKYSPQQKPGFVSLEGYMAAKFFVQAVEAAGRDLTREGLISAIENKGTFDLGGITLTFSYDDHQGMDKIHYTVIDKEDFKSVNSLR